jgi:hypothetical protein
MYSNYNLVLQLCTLSYWYRYIYSVLNSDLKDSIPNFPSNYSFLEFFYENIKILAALLLLINLGIFIPVLYFNTNLKVVDLNELQQCISRN